MRTPALAGLLLAALLAGTALPARAAPVGLTLGPTVGGGSLVGGVVQVQLSRPLYLEAEVGYRGGWSVGHAYYPNLMFAGGLSTQFGQRPWRSGFFANVATTLPFAFYEAWVALGWSSRFWGPRDLRSFTLDLGPAIYLYRDLPPGTDLDELPFFVHARVAWHFPLVTRSGNASVRRPPSERKRKKDEEAPVEPGPAEPAPPTEPPAPSG